MNESGLTTVLERAVERLDPDVTGLVAGAAQRGRRQVRRRRGAALAAGSAVAAVVVGAAAWQSAPGTTTAHDPAATRPAPPTPLPPPPLTPASAAGLTPENQRSLAPDDVVVERFVRHLPGRRISDLRMTPIDDITGIQQHGLEVDLRIDGAGIEVRLYDMSAEGRPFSARRACGTPECRRLADGSWLWERSGDGGDGSDTSGFTANWSGLFAPDGWMVDVSATNRHDTGQPVLDLDRLTALATADLWFE